MRGSNFSTRAVEHALPNVFNSHPQPGQAPLPIPLHSRGVPSTSRHKKQTYWAALAWILATSKSRMWCMITITPRVPASSYGLQPQRTRARTSQRLDPCVSTSLIRRSAKRPTAAPHPLPRARYLRRAATIGNHSQYYRPKACSPLCSKMKITSVETQQDRFNRGRNDVAAREYGRRSEISLLLIVQNRHRAYAQGSESWETSYVVSGSRAMVS